MSRRLPLAALILLLCLGPVAAYGSGQAEAPLLRIRTFDEKGQAVTGARVRAGNAGEDGTLHQAWPEFEEEVVRAGETSSEGSSGSRGSPWTGRSGL